MVTIHHFLSVLLENTEYIADNVCLRYRLHRLHSKGFCQKNIKYIVLGVCATDTDTVTEIDLNGLIQSVYDENGNDLHCWSVSAPNEVIGLRINVEVNMDKTFSICLRDVFNMNGDMSDTVSMKRGRTSFVCNEQYMMGLPCIDNDKFESGSYSNTGFNKKFGRYRGWGYKKRKGDWNRISDAMIVEESTDIDNKSNDMYISWSVVTVVCICCIVLSACGLKICGQSRHKIRTTSYDRAPTTMNDDEINVITDDDDQSEGNDSTLYEELYYDETKTRTDH